jgi:alpha-N-acetylglucosaminidase
LLVNETNLCCLAIRFLLGTDFNHYHRYDLVDLTRQCLSKLANEVYLDAMSSYQKQDFNGLNFHTKKFLELIEDIDTLLAADDNFLLGTWLESAKSLAMTEDECKQVASHSLSNIYISDQSSFTVG